MSPLFDRIDGFVRWFFNSSPTVMAIEPHDPGRPAAPAASRSECLPDDSASGRREPRGGGRTGTKHRGRVMA